MGFIRDMLRTAGEISTLTSQLKFSQNENERLVWQITELEKTVKSERAAKDKFVNKFCDQISKQQGLPMKFEEKAPPPPPEPVKVSAYDEMQIEQLAKQMQDNALQVDGLDLSLDFCVERVRENLPQLRDEGAIQ